MRQVFDNFVLYIARMSRAEIGFLDLLSLLVDATGLFASHN